MGEIPTGQFPEGYDPNDEAKAALNPETKAEAQERFDIVSQKLDEKQEAFRSVRSLAGLATACGVTVGALLLPSPGWLGAIPQSQEALAQGEPAKALITAAMPALLAMVAAMGTISIPHLFRGLKEMRQLRREKADALTQTRYGSDQEVTNGTD